MPAGQQRVPIYVTAKLYVMKLVYVRSQYLVHGYPNVGWIYHMIFCRILSRNLNKESMTGTNNSREGIAIAMLFLMEKLGVDRQNLYDFSKT